MCSRAAVCRADEILRDLGFADRDADLTPKERAKKFSELSEDYLEGFDSGYQYGVEQEVKKKRQIREGEVKRIEREAFRRGQVEGIKMSDRRWRAKWDAEIRQAYKKGRDEGSEFGQREAWAATSEARDRMIAHLQGLIDKKAEEKYRANLVRNNASIEPRCRIVWKEPVEPEEASEPENPKQPRPPDAGIKKGNAIVAKLVAKAKLDRQLNEEKAILEELGTRVDGSDSEESEVPLERQLPPEPEQKISRLPVPSQELKWQQELKRLQESRQKQEPRRQQEQQRLRELKEGNSQRKALKKTVRKRTYHELERPDPGTRTAAREERKEQRLAERRKQEEFYQSIGFFWTTG